MEGQNQTQTQVPKLKRTLYIGLGGTGFKTLLYTKRAFIETYGEVPPMIKFLAIDSDQNQYQTTSLPSSHGEIKFNQSEASDISVYDVEDVVQGNRDSFSWLPDQNLRAVVDLVNGCGMVRTNGRVAFALNYRKIRQNIQSAINQICNLSIIQNNKYALLGNNVEVNIVFSIGGGTGSGTFLDTAYLVKDIFRAQALPNTSKIVGYMVLPDVYDAQLVFGKERLFPNGWGALVDLDRFMHMDFTENVTAKYYDIEKNLNGAPFNTIIAISNKNQNGYMVNHCEHLADMLSLALVVSAGQLSSGQQSTANNLERDMNSGVYDRGGKRAIFGTLGMSEIIFRGSYLSELYSVKMARELAAKLLVPGSNLDNVANSWIDNVQIRENNGQDQVINFLLKREPDVPISCISNEANPKDDINRYKGQDNVAVNTERLTEQVNKLISKTKKAFDDQLRSLVDSHGPVYALEFSRQLRDQINICLKEMQQERERALTSRAQFDSDVNAAVEDYKKAQSKFIGKRKAVDEASAILCSAVYKEAINEREIQRRNGAISFYKWLLTEMASAEKTLGDIETSIKNACEVIRTRIAAVDSQLRKPRGLFEVDLTHPYIDKVLVNPDMISINQFVRSLPNGVNIYTFGNMDGDEVAKLMIAHTSTLNSGQTWEKMGVEDALNKLPKDEVKQIITKAIALSSPMCSLRFGRYRSENLMNYYYIGVQEQSVTALNGRIVNINECIPSNIPFQTSFASIGSRDRIVFYHQYGVFPTFAIAGSEAYRSSHDDYMSGINAYSCFIDEEQRIKMVRNGFSVLPQEQADNTLEMWVKGLIFGLITRDDEGSFQYKDETNSEKALFGYWTSLGSKYRDEAFRNFKRECVRLQPQFEKFMTNKAKSEGQDAFNAILAAAKIDYLQKYSLNDLSTEELKNKLYDGIARQLTNEVNFVKQELS